MTIQICLEDLLSESGTERPYPIEKHKLTVHETDSRLIFLDNIDRELDCDLIIFLSRHSSIRPEPVLTVHVTGNIADAGLGGIAGSLAVASPEWMHAVLGNLVKNAPEGYRVTYEVTHHGPTELATPSFFVEIGSTEKEWTDLRAGFAVARSVLESDPGNTINMVGIGGTHYARRETEIALRSRTAFGHIVHSRYLSSLSSSMIAALLEKSQAKAVYIDKKAISPSEIHNVKTILADLCIPCLSEHELLRFQNISWFTWKEIQRVAEQVAPGAEVNIPPGIRDGIPKVVRLPEDLFNETIRVDCPGLKDGLGNLPVVTFSSKGSSLLPVFITTVENTERVLHDLISLCVTLICSGETTAVDGDQLIISRTRFDPEKARILGIPMGPLYGELMKGRTVNVNGREITSDMVRTRTTTCIRIPGLERQI